MTPRPRFRPVVTPITHLAISYTHPFARSPPSPCPRPRPTPLTESMPSNDFYDVRVAGKYTNRMPARTPTPALSAIFAIIIVVIVIAGIIGGLSREPRWEGGGRGFVPYLSIARVTCRRTHRASSGTLLCHAPAPPPSTLSFLAPPHPSPPLSSPPSLLPLSVHPSVPLAPPRPLQGRQPSWNVKLQFFLGLCSSSSSFIPLLLSPSLPPSSISLSSTPHPLLLHPTPAASHCSSRELPNECKE